MTLPSDAFESAPNPPEDPADPGRRSAIAGILRGTMGGFLLGGGLVGCATTTSRVARPSPVLPSESARVAAPVPRPRFVAPAVEPALAGMVRSRGAWTSTSPRSRDMRRMAPLQALTIHHDGLQASLDRTDERSNIARLDLIRRSHTGQGWADIGYHFAIDRGGRVWQCRPLDWEGAHVRSHNSGNIGVLVMGNFEVQRPHDRQLVALNAFVGLACRHYGIPAGRVKTHREWSRARTSCPGRHLQGRVVAMRSLGFRA